MKSIQHPTEVWIRQEMTSVQDKAEAGCGVSETDKPTAEGKA